MGPLNKKQPLPLEYSGQESHADIIDRVYDALQIDDSSVENFIQSLPFSTDDATFGCENEFQAVVMGKSNDVDLPITIRDSACYKNLLKRNERDGENHRKIAGFEAYLNSEGACTSKDKHISAMDTDVWENSWVRFPRHLLNLYANQILDSDLHCDKQNPSAGYRRDMQRFFVEKDGIKYLRIPVSYLLKIALADALGNPCIHSRLRNAAGKMMACFLSDNSSPEILSFFPCSIKTGRLTGLKPVRETAIRFLLIQLLTAYANKRFQLAENGQRVLVYFASHTPQRQKHFNQVIPDAFYRDIFMSPCLSGWDRGEDKSAYMHMCHRVLSRSRLNAVTKLKDAGIITSNLVVLPDVSDVSLANNGTHVSIGSMKITGLLKEDSPDFTRADEKYLGDLCIKVCEHFLPLFVGTYSAAPYRLDFQDFHPEKILGFLPHELDFTHLRMIWKQWKKKAGLKIMSQPLTPFGPEAVDRFIRRAFSLKGDMVPDFRLVDYFAGVMATDENSALDGKEGNEDRLAADLQEMGVFDSRMSLYMLMRLRKESVHGFSGFEARYYSTFESLFKDFGEALQLQRIILTLVWKMILKKEVVHEDIPDMPEVESERRQMFFGAAIGIKTVFILEKTPNRFLGSILKVIEKRKKVFKSIKYPGYFKIGLQDYLIGLVDILEERGADIIRGPELLSILKNLRKRIKFPLDNRAAHRMGSKIIEKAKKKSPMAMRAKEFNRACEDYLREDLRKQHMSEGIKALAEDFQQLDLWASFRDPVCNEVRSSILGDLPASDFLASHRDELFDETADEDILEKMIQLIVLTVAWNTDKETSKKQNTRF